MKGIENMWRCAKCETNNEDTAESCVICHMVKKELMMRGKREETLKEVQKCTESRNYQAAVQILKNMLLEYPDDSELQSLYKKYEALYITDVVISSNVTAEMGHTDEAIKTLRETSAFLNRNVRINDEINMISRKSKKRWFRSLEIVLAIFAIVLTLILICIFLWMYVIN